MASKVKISDLVASTSRYAKKAATAADKNKNAKLTAIEAKSLPADLKDDYKRQAKKNAAITPASFARDQAAYVAANAKKADKNHDGYLSEAEQAALPADLKDNLASYKAHVGGPSTGGVSSPFVAAGAGTPATIAGKNVSGLALSPAAEGLMTTMENQKGGSTLFSAAWKLKPSELAAAMTDPDFMNQLLFESTGTSYQRDYPQYYSADSLVETDTTAAAAAQEMADDLKSTTDTGQLAQTTASLTALMKQPGVVFKRLSWSNQDDAAFAGVMAFNPKTGLITSFGWMNEP